LGWGKGATNEKGRGGINLENRSLSFGETAGVIGLKRGGKFFKRERASRSGGGDRKKPKTAANQKIVFMKTPRYSLGMREQGRGRLAVEAPGAEPCLLKVDLVMV